jgi:hypothetical protein
MVRFAGGLFLGALLSCWLFSHVSSELHVITAPDSTANVELVSHDTVVFRVPAYSNSLGNNYTLVREVDSSIGSVDGCGVTFSYTAVYLVNNDSSFKYVNEMLEAPPASKVLDFLFTYPGAPCTSERIVRATLMGLAVNTSMLFINYDERLQRWEPQEVEMYSLPATVVWGPFPRGYSVVETAERDQCNSKRNTVTHSAPRVTSRYGPTYYSKTFTRSDLFYYKSFYQCGDHATIAHRISNAPDAVGMIVLGDGINAGVSAAPSALVLGLVCCFLYMLLLI